MRFYIIEEGIIIDIKEKNNTKNVQIALIIYALSCRPTRFAEVSFFLVNQHLFADELQADWGVTIHKVP